MVTLLFPVGITSNSKEWGELALLASLVTGLCFMEVFGPFTSLRGGQGYEEFLGKLLLLNE